MNNQCNNNSKNVYSNTTYDSSVEEENMVINVETCGGWKAVY